jgi:GTP cyclohydrolase I
MWILKKQKKHKLVNKIPSRQEAEDAVLTLIKYASSGTANQEVIQNTPSRVIKAYDELFAGYDIEIDDLSKKFANDFQYHDIVAVEGINFASTCEHHMLPITGVIHAAYIPSKSVIGISKIARIIHAVTRKLQLQERMTSEIVEKLSQATDSLGVAVYVRASHGCMILRGVKECDSITTTIKYSGLFLKDQDKRNQFNKIIEGFK